jgi:hypothetical protein
MMTKIKVISVAISLGLAASFAQAQTLITIIGEATGNGNFEATTAVGDALPYSATPSWENINQDTDPNFSVTAGMSGHPENDEALGGAPGTNLRGGFLYKDRFSGNTTSYTIGAAGDVFTCKFDISRHGGAATWVDGGTVEAILFTTTATVDATYNTTTDTSYVQLASFTYEVLAEPFWQTNISAGTLYAATANDVGKKVYLALTLRTAGSASPFPRADNVTFQVIAQPVLNPTWYGYPITDDGVSVDTGSFLGWVDISFDPWIYLYATGDYVYTGAGFSGSGGWVFWPNW